MKKILIAVLACLTLAACGPSHEGEHCAASHTALVPMTNCYAYNAQGVCTMPVTTYYEDTVCDSWAPDNPATASKELK